MYLGEPNSIGVNPLMFLKDLIIPESESKSTSFLMASKLSDSTATCSALFLLMSTAFKSHLSSKARYIKTSYSLMFIESNRGVSLSPYVGSSLICSNEYSFFL